MTSSILLRNLRVIALKLNKLFEIWISHHFVTKNNLRGITKEDRAYMGELSSPTLYSLLYWMMVNDVRRCWAKFYFHQTFDTTPSNISFVLRCENLSWICFTGTCNNLEHMHVLYQYQIKSNSRRKRTRHWTINTEYQCGSLMRYVVLFVQLFQFIKTKSQLFCSN